MRAESERAPALGLLAEAERRQAAQADGQEQLLARRQLMPKRNLGLRPVETPPVERRPSVPALALAELAQVEQAARRSQASPGRWTLAVRIVRPGPVMLWRSEPYQMERVRKWQPEQP